MTEGVLRMRELLIRAALDILKLENRVAELETLARIPVNELFTVRVRENNG
jgi:hypothetical protein